MIFESQSYYLIFQDAVHSLGIGFITGFVYQLLGIFLYKGRKKLFVRDVATGLFFTVAMFSYSVSFANYPVMRWYMVVFAVIGMVMFTPAFSHRAHRILVTVCSFIYSCVNRRSNKICVRLLENIKKKQLKKQKNTQKNASEVLKENNIMLYN